MRLRLTTHLPIGGERIGPTIWFGSVERGWTGKPLAPWRWGMTWRISSGDTDGGNQT